MQYSQEVHTAFFSSNRNKRFEAFQALSKFGVMGNFGFYDTLCGQHYCVSFSLPFCYATLIHNPEV